MDRIRRSRARGGRQELPLRYRGVGLAQSGAEILQEFPNLVVLTPHHLRRSGDPVAFQTREEQVLFALIMLVDILQFVESLPPFEQRGRRVAVIRGLEDPIHRLLQACDGLAQGLVLPAKRVYGMTRKNRRAAPTGPELPG